MDVVILVKVVICVKQTDSQHGIRNKIDCLKKMIGCLLL